MKFQEANSTFDILLNESTRRLKLLTKRLGNCIEKSAPYYESLEKARLAQIQCQVAAAQFQRANGSFGLFFYVIFKSIIFNFIIKLYFFVFLLLLEIHAAAKETVALAEERFMTNSHNWPFDNAWQEMLNHATHKVGEAEKKKAECHAEHQRKARVFSEAEMEVCIKMNKFLEINLHQF